jgi:hypothetical protein
MADNKETLELAKEIRAEREQELKKVEPASDCLRRKIQIS